MAPPPTGAQPGHVMVEGFDEPAPPASNITWAPLDLVVGTVRVEFEHAFGERFSMHLTAGALLFDGLGVTIPDGSSYYALAGGLGARFFLTGYAPEGFWIGPRAQLAYASITLDDTTGSGVGYSAGAELGYTWIFGDAFVLSVGGGATYIDIEAQASSGTSTATAGTSGVSPTLRFNLGVAF